ncbi:MAG TPA: toll/interleukin-1 receptor domain-containing protein [Aggregatilineaceae bacterium]|nr:toll/interleukin-1 receptor domain-containing protein [Aggregatilineaceae bacterium]
MARIFISYSRQNKEFAHQLAADLDQLGGDVWFDVDDIHPTEDWADTIHQALKECQLMIIVISPTSMASKNVAQEWKFFLSLGKPILPVLLEPAEVHFQLANLQYVDFLNQDYETAFAQLHSELRRQGQSLASLTQRDPHVRIPTQPALRSYNRSNRTMCAIGATVILLIGIAALRLLLSQGDDDKGGDKTATATNQAAAQPTDEVASAPTDDRLQPLLAQYTQTAAAYPTETQIPTQTPNGTETQQYWETVAEETVIAGWTATPNPSLNGPTATWTPKPPTSTSTLTLTSSPTLTPTDILQPTQTPLLETTTSQDTTSRPCIVRTDQLYVPVRVGPGTNRSARANFPINTDIPVVGKAMDESDTLWWNIQPPGYDPLEADRYWVVAEDVEEVGGCDMVSNVDASQVVPFEESNADNNGSSGNGGSSPVITRINIPPNGRKYCSDFQYSITWNDPDGDAVRIEELSMSLTSVNISGSNGTYDWGHWSCEFSYCTYVFQVVDAAGNRSNLFSRRIYCP